MPGVKEEYQSLRKSIEDRYARLCSADSKFQAMFCSECEAIGKRIFAANAKGGLGGCAAAAVVASPDPTAPAKPEEGSGAPAAAQPEGEG